MFNGRFISFLMASFSPRSRLQFLTKPLFTMLLFLGGYVVVEYVVMGENPAGAHLRLMVVALAELPFLVLAFILVIHLDRATRLMSDQAMTDVLTDLPNRRAFVIDTERLIRKNYVGFLLIIDADHFKRVNDTYGHAVGDFCLKAIADRIEAACGGDDVVGRIGGEEFGAFLPHRSLAELTTIGKRLCAGLMVDVPDLVKPLRLTMSIGATETNKREDLNAALKRADKALYAAKGNGRAQMQIWRKSTPARAA